MQDKGLQIVVGHPPNFNLISLAFPITRGHLFCYGTTLFNPSGSKIPEDIYEHERIHSQRQKDPELWWNQYLLDRDFRYEEELIAYAHQYKWIKERFSAAVQKEALTELAHNLSTMYNLGITLQEAESKIRNRTKTL